ncbi:MAG TPA: YbaK/EbsC family protein [Anaerolineaceae bacterium]
MENQNLSSSPRRVQQALKMLGAPCQVVELQASTRTAIEAAQAVGCQLGQIVKSLIFVLQPANQYILVLVSGENRVNEKNLGKLLGGKIVKADAFAVQQMVGYAIGGVPPVGLDTSLPTYIDEDLLKYDVIWAAAGTPHAVFQITSKDLLRVTNGKVISVK